MVSPEGEDHQSDVEIRRHREGIRELGFTISIADSGDITNLEHYPPFILSDTSMNKPKFLLRLALLLGLI
ncbi:hypothetical protein L1987_23036 [Smallanthus sonchifolius]|uniref:Uncharacterized protein n=2 Tax=Smallanthus sonchifolius TaxID=185202 RepID=A0ACB8Z8R1_9ASTR|nr:hypothetical protein L1987_76609 [Smallanthus sonchifolius]KAI3807114.1 hypothetical protein L1987_23036 [Smallanthus sonchifolius]